MKYSSQPEPAHCGRRKRLVRRFETLESFRDEYRRNVANGGIFVATEDRFATRELVDVVLELAWCDEGVPLEGEVVRCVPVALRETGAEPGVSLQLVDPAGEALGRLREFADLPPCREGVDLRREQRRATRVPGRVETSAGEIAGQTENLSRSGVLMTVAGEPLAEGTPVRVSLKHPTTGESRELLGSVVRSTPDENGARVAIQFEADGTLAGEVGAFIEDVQFADHARRLGAIGGPIGSLGLANLLQMFSSCAESGSLALVRDQESGAVGFESANLCYAHTGGVSGVKALARLFAWSDGVFEFNESLDESVAQSSPIPIYGAVMEAMTQLDELGRLDISGLPCEALVEVDLAVLLDADGDIGKIERMLVSKVSEGTHGVGALLDELPEFDAEIYAALLSLQERGVLRVGS